jgi:CheY-like chemotaxis protein
MTTLDLTELTVEGWTGDANAPGDRRLVYGVLLVEVATAHLPRSPSRSWLRCVRVAAGEPWCMGELALEVVSDDEVHWRCPSCGDQGRVVGWKGSTCDLTQHQDTDRATDPDGPDGPTGPSWRRHGTQPAPPASAQRILLVQADTNTRMTMLRMLESAGMQRILLVQADTNTRKTMLRMLESAGMQVTPAATVREACDAIDALQPGADDGFDAVTVALALRDGTYRDVVAHMRRRGHITQYLITHEQA